MVQRQNYKHVVTHPAVGSLAHELVELVCLSFIKKVPYANAELKRRFKNVEMEDRNISVTITAFIGSFKLFIFLLHST